MRQAEKTISKRWSVIGCILLAGEAFLCIPAFAAGAVKEENLRADIVYRCYNLMGEFGAEGVDACVKGEQSAMQALSAYPQQAGEIVQRCTRQVQISGWELAKSCVDQDVAAESALARYGDEHAAVLEECRRRFEERGAAQVKACADERIAAARKVKKD